MPWSSLIFDLKNLFKPPDKKEWLESLIHDLEKHKAENHVLRFKITMIKEHGFQVKVGGLIGFIHFAHMPWSFSNNAKWIAVAPYLTNKIFHCTIYKLTTDPLSIIVNGNFAQFREPELTDNEVYSGIIISKCEFGVFVDIGFHFGWKNGSVVGLFHRSQFHTDELFDSSETGQSLSVRYKGINKKDQHVFVSSIDVPITPAIDIEKFHNRLEKSIEEVEQLKANAESLIGETVWVRVKIHENYARFLVKDQFVSILPINSTIYPKHINQIRSEKNALTDGEIIYCHVLKLDEQRCAFVLKWDIEILLTEEKSNSIMNLLDEKTLSLLKSVREEINE